MDETGAIASAEVRLTATEYGLLRGLSLNAGQVVTDDALLRQICGGRETGGANLMRNFVKRLRAKLGEDTARPAFVFNVRGVGYRTAEPGKSGSNRPG